MPPSVTAPLPALSVKFCAPLTVPLKERAPLLPLVSIVKGLVARVISCVSDTEAATKVPRIVGAELAPVCVNAPPIVIVLLTPLLKLPEVIVTGPVMEGMALSVKFPEMTMPPGPSRSEVIVFEPIVICAGLGMVALIDAARTPVTRMKLPPL